MNSRRDNKVFYLTTTNRHSQNKIKFSDSTLRKISGYKNQIFVVENVFTNSQEVMITNIAMLIIL